MCYLCLAHARHVFIHSPVVTLLHVDVQVMNDNVVALRTIYLVAVFVINHRNEKCQNSCRRN